MFNRINPGAEDFKYSQIRITTITRIERTHHRPASTAGLASDADRIQVNHEHDRRAAGVVRAVVYPRSNPDQAIELLPVGEG